MIFLSPYHFLILLPRIAIVDKVLGEKHHLATVTVTVRPLDDHNLPVQVHVASEEEGEEKQKLDEMESAAREGALSACQQGIEDHGD